MSCTTSWTTHCACNVLVPHTRAALSPRKIHRDSISYIDHDPTISPGTVDGEKHPSVRGRRDAGTVTARDYPP